VGNRLRAGVDAAAPRLASAMLFDDVSRLATTDERTRVAREIHDGIAQDLASVAYLIDDIGRDTDELTGTRLGEVGKHIRSLISELRLRIFDLRSGVDESVGLGTTMGEYAQRLGAQAGLVVHTSIDESPRRLPIAVEIELLRIFQEAVTNVRRHAQASNVWISLTGDPPHARLSVVDDGRGLRGGRPDSMGITGMRERAQRIGAQLTIEPGPDRGTCVEVVVGRPAGKRERVGPQEATTPGNPAGGTS
jgi:signal transduction histidine kinase